ncbi:hypothetical protein L6R50_14735 [Myxococcota bacterium]|nr:hypothetical protein [Myxococcota bacterium]
MTRAPARWLAAGLALLSACGGGERGADDAPSRAAEAAAVAPLLTGWSAEAVARPGDVDALFQGPAAGVWTAVLARDVTAAVKAADALLAARELERVPADERVAAARAHIDLGTTWLAAWELDRLALAAYADFREEAKERLLPSRWQGFFASAAATPPGEPGPEPPRDLAGSAPVAAVRALAAATGDAVDLAPRIAAVAWEEPDAVEVLQPATASTPEVRLAHHDPRRYRALGRAHLLRAARILDGMPGQARLLAALAAARAGQPPAEPPPLPPGPPEIPAFFASAWPGPVELRAALADGSTAGVLPQLAMLREALEVADSRRVRWAAATTAAEVDALLDRRVGLDEALVAELRARKGADLTEDDRTYAAASLDAAVRAAAAEQLARAGDAPPRRDVASSADAPAALAARLLQQSLPGDGSAPFRAPPAVRLVLARAWLQAGSAWRASALVTDLADGPLPGLRPVRESLANLDAAWTGGRTEGPRSD